MNLPAAAAVPHDAMTSSQPWPAASERRRRKRFHERFPAAIFPGGGGAIRGVGKDLDDEGICVRTDRPVPVGRSVRVRFDLPRCLASAVVGLSCRARATVRDLRACDPRRGAGYEVVLKLERPLPDLVSRRVASHKKLVAALIGTFLVLTFWFKWGSIRYFWYEPLVYTYSWVISLFFLSRFILAWMYRAPALSDYTPSVSICISVRNDEAAIGRAIETCYEAEYPPGKREVIVVDDGSTDGTPRVLAEMKVRYPELKLSRIAPSGKRHGMTAAIRQATGDIIVVVDSDTFLDRMALRHIVSGFEDPTLGAVSGHTEVDNVAQNTLTGLQQVRYYVSFKLLKTSESLFGAVTCCPGCLSAYRREYLVAILDDWLNQKFMGAPATFGDDRSLTNYILRNYRVTYNENAICTTISPDTWMKYMRQQVRWKKSWLRETLIASSFMWKKHPVAAISFYVGAVVSLLSPFMAYRAFTLALTNPDAVYLYYVSGLLLYGMAQSLFYLNREANSHWLLGMVMMASGLILGPQTYYAILTMRKNHWGTR